MPATTPSQASAALKLAASALLAFAGHASAQQEPITAVYKAQEISFQYRTYADRFTYPCHELEQRISNILRAVGARDDIDVDVRNCDSFRMGDDASMDPMSRRDGMDTWGEDRWGTSSRFRRPGDQRDQTVSVRVRLMMPVEVTPKILEEIEKDKSRRELVSRVTGNAAAAFNDPVIFAAQRQEVTLSQRTIRLRPEDCGLLEQMSNTVFRRLDVKVVRRSVSCGREASRIAPQLIAEALLPTGALLPMPDPEKEKQKGAGPSTEEPESSTAEPAEPAAPTPPQ